MELKGTVSFATVKKTIDGHTHITTHTFDGVTVEFPEFNPTVQFAIKGPTKAQLPVTFDAGSIEALVELAKKLPLGPGPYGRGE